MFKWPKSFDWDIVREALGIVLVFEGILFCNAQNPTLRAVGIGGLVVGLLLIVVNQVVRDFLWARLGIHGDSKDPVMRSIQVSVAEMSDRNPRVELRLNLPAQANARLEEMTPPGENKVELVRRALALYDSLYEHGVMTGESRLFVGTAPEKLIAEIVVIQQDE